jgi:nitrogen fixation protein FixH
MKHQSNISSKTGRNVFLSILAFFIIFASADAYFIYKAVSTNTGLITENAYEKGLNYNKTLEKLEKQNQSGIKSKAFYKDGFLTYHLHDINNKPITNAIVKAEIIRPIKVGYDFNRSLQHIQNGLYKSKIDFPLKGLWTIKIGATWQQQKTTSQQQQNQTILDIVIQD